MGSFLRQIRIFSFLHSGLRTHPRHSGTGPRTCAFFPYRQLFSDSHYIDSGYFFHVVHPVPPGASGLPQQRYLFPAFIQVTVKIVDLVSKALQGWIFSSIHLLRFLWRLTRAATVIFVLVHWTKMPRCIIYSDLMNKVTPIHIHTLYTQSHILGECLQKFGSWYLSCAISCC